MNLLLKRIAKKQLYTIGKLYIDGQYFCDTIEDVDRGLNQSMSLSQIQQIKIKDQTAIPTGTYQIDMNTVSPKYSNYAKYYWAKPYGAKLPRLINVPGYQGILIHVGNTQKDTSGCIIVGQNKVVGKVINSTIIMQKLMTKLLSSKDKITITIE